MIEKIIKRILIPLWVLLLCMCLPAVATAATPVSSTNNRPTYSQKEKVDMPNIGDADSEVKQFDLSAREYIDVYNKKYGSLGMTLEADQKRDDCWFTINGERTDIRIQFCDKVNGPWTTGSGLDMEKWNWLYAYIATDDYTIDIEYFASWPMFCSFLASVVDCEFTQQEFIENCEGSGPDGYPVLTYIKDGIKNEIQFRDASVGNYHQTVYSASVEIIQ